MTFSIAEPRLKICAIILNWRDAARAIALARTLQESIQQLDSIYIVDNASPDDSLTQLAACSGNISVLTNLLNSGYSGGNNFGMQTAFANGHDIALILNPDVDVRMPPSAGDALRAYAKNAGKAIIAIPVRDPTTDKETFPCKPSSAVNMLLASIPKSLPESEAKSFCGGAIAITRQLYETAGGFDESLFMYCEELDYALRCANSGGTIIYATDMGFVYREDGYKTRKTYVFYYQPRNLIRILTDAGVGWKRGLFVAITGLRDGMRRIKGMSFPVC
jgi:GT2 family glycosyltransferase